MLFAHILMYLSLKFELIINNKYYYKNW